MTSLFAFLASIIEMIASAGAGVASIGFGYEAALWLNALMTSIPPIYSTVVALICLPACTTAPYFLGYSFICAI